MAWSDKATLLTGITAVAGNAAAASRTATNTVAEMSAIQVAVSVTIAGAGAKDCTLTAVVRGRGSGLQATYQASDLVAGVETLSDWSAVHSCAAASTTIFHVSLDVENIYEIALLATITGGAAGDSITMEITGSLKR